jgi:UDP-N-acetylglucosamine transferase subunit ALG13
MQIKEIQHKNIYYAVLNWGLGHATRSAPLLKQLMRQGNTLTVFSTGLALHYLKNEFPQLRFIDFKTSDITYPKHSQLWMSLVLQFKKINQTILKENQIFTQYCHTHGSPDLVISDNCYGFYSKTITSILITHQINIKSPFFQKQAQKTVHAYIKKFHLVWIPDVDGDLNLAGELARPILKDIDTTFIGPLSHLHSLPTPTGKKFTYCAIISGPEKQRTIFEDEVYTFLKNKAQPSVLIRGTTSKHHYHSNTIQVLDLVLAPELNNLIANSQFIIARSGYSTVMDMYVWQKPCILIPTPGQTEQEYLFKKHFPSQSTDLKSINEKTIETCKG